AVRGDWDVVDQLAEIQALSSSARGLASLAQRARQQPVAVLDEVATLRRGGMQKWCDAAVRLAVEQLIPAHATAQWHVLLERMGRVCEGAADQAISRELQALVATDRLQLRVAVIGEFSVGKTTLMNAWLGAEVGPVGIKPTTAYATWLAYAPDDYVRIDLTNGPSRVLPHAELRACLAKLDDNASVSRVSIYSHKHELQHLLLLDTPGFNAGKDEHEERAWQAVDEADIVIWVSDATAPLKDSERRVLEAIGQRGIPVQIVLNKVDRLATDERDSVLHYVRTKADTLGTRLIGPPFGMSAREALREKLQVVADGDLDDPSSSGWCDWRQFVRAELVARATLHVERAMRRRAAALAMRLGAAASDAKPADRSPEAFALQTFASRCRSEGHEMACQLLDALGIAMNALRDDLEPLRHLSPDGIPADATNYVIGRSLARVHPVLCQQFIEGAGAAKEQARSAARPLFYGLIVAAAASSPTPLTASRLLVPLTAAITEIGSQLQGRIPDVGANLDSAAYELDCVVRSLMAPLEVLEQEPDESTA
ncbi:MAG: dynamin family protein, partial [Polyangiaceae bacterium]